MEDLSGSLYPKLPTPMRQPEPYRPGTSNTGLQPTPAPRTNFPKEYKASTAHSYTSQSSKYRPPVPPHRPKWSPDHGFETTNFPAPSHITTADGYHFPTDASQKQPSYCHQLNADEPVEVQPVLPQYESVRHRETLPRQRLSDSHIPIITPLV